MKIPATPPSSLVPARNWHFQYLAENMRPDEQMHWLALSGAQRYEPDTAALGFMNTPGIRMAVLRADGVPAVAGGFTRLRGQTFEGWMVGSIDGWANRWRDITRAVRWTMREQFRSGAHRIQIITLESRHEACEWYESALAMYKESTLVGAGAHGENLAMYVCFGEGWR